MWTAIAIGYHIASRLAYAIGVGAMLKAQDERQYFTRDASAQEGFDRFKRVASWIMNNDAVSFILLCLVTRETLFLDIPLAARVGCGLLLVATGIGVKLWAAKGLGGDAYYWGNFFFPIEYSANFVPPGPYRYLRNPMYTVGYLHSYGWALLCASTIGLAAAVFDQVAILIFNEMVEKPHFERLKAER